MEELYKRLEQIAGEIGVYLIRRSAPKGVILNWVERLRQIADSLEEKAR